MKKMLEFIKRHRDIVYIILLIIFGVIISGQCSRVNKLGDEIDRQENNRLALTEELSNYRDEIGRINAEKHAYQLTQEELRDSIGLLKKKNREYISYIAANIGIKDTVRVETIITRDEYVDAENGEIKFEKNETFGKSNRNISVNIPYKVEDHKFFTGDAIFSLKQNIFVEGWLERNTETKETFIHLRSDYPNVVFNSGMGVVVENKKTYEKEVRRNCGIGFAVGPSIGMSYDLNNKNFIPTIGIGVTIGFTFTPKWTQW